MFQTCPILESQETVLQFEALSKGLIAESVTIAHDSECSWLLSSADGKYSYPLKFWFMVHAKDIFDLLCEDTPEMWDRILTGVSIGKWMKPLRQIGGSGNHKFHTRLQHYVLRSTESARPCQMGRRIGPIYGWNLRRLGPKEPSYGPTLLASVSLQSSEPTKYPPMFKSTAWGLKISTLFWSLMRHWRVEASWTRPSSSASCEAVMLRNYSVLGRLQFLWDML